MIDFYENNKDFLSSNIACTIIKVQEKKTQKGNSYGIIKFSDLSNVFELFIFSEVFESNRDNLKEGKSILITLIKSYIDENKVQKRVNVKKIVSLKDIANNPIKNITFKFNNIDELKKLKNLSHSNGETKVKIHLNLNDEILIFRLKDKRKIDNNLLNSLNLEEKFVFE